ncbi:heme utilization protein [Metapseudomonas boanensis]|uniref:Heme utilization protein n=1 Tax=Metapseudomonas boanensis TaxID=2822138 RepID=A0ABS5XMH0_9GAMM|nr:heme utilization protein [Pseudomonas boanensis]MBT8768914.1 heme utilization protein [Pseudomonas boanensis]
MKVEMILKPLAFAMAVALSTGVMAEGYRHHDGASATVKDTQENYYNDVDNEATKNTATIEGSLDNATGNIGANVVAGDNNQQANAAAIATADAFFVFGHGAGLEANASIEVTQKAHDNDLYNDATQNNATVVDSANGTQGNVGINVAAGNFNQQKNDMAVASSEKAFTASADVNVSQESNNNYTDNKVGDVYEVGPEMTTVASGFGWWPPHHDKPQTPVVNNATLQGSLNDVSGNVGVNIAAGGGNQQSNSLAIAAGCNACIAR